MQKIKNIFFEVIYAVLPVTVVIIILQAILRLSIDIIIQFLIGVMMVTIGLILFSLGVQIGLLPLGETIGAALPKTGKAWVVILFGFLLGFVVTVAEPDVRVLATQIDIVSKGVISKNLLISAVALGVAIFVGLAILRIILGSPMKHLLIVAYGLVFILAAFTPAEFLAISLDAGGVTTGPVTVPFIIALGIGVASVLGGKSASSDGFGLIALASVGPILAVLLLGVIYR
ncbi:DUF1538 domain-containing protein [Carboxydothermus hydrogenoformans]|uniref:Putative membrane protein n=1 Tax=Carboxydothermus hydrogenoformans (strain ATCC BAA-161 / DSM 6008 / Z-2901) TaxID=246194 RepID=Q3ACU7_CARHZ|nr:DUF1538 domain-containing protein [Carboxydothermus hydrogenoformans]ABB14577.1 putative membrane protein [Carboxydothermus hydrogenoformans Z-2901]